MTTPPSTPGQSSVTSAVEKREHGPIQMVQDYEQDYALVLPSHHKSATWVRLAVGCLRRDANLRRVAEKNPASLMQALLECARLGHEPGTESFYLVPMGNEIEGWEGYRGVVDRMFRAGGVTSVKAELVHEKDGFHYEPAAMARPDHKVDWFGDRGEIIGAYAYAEMVGGGTSRVVVINRAYIDKVKRESRGSDKPTSPWQKWFGAMVLKTAIHRLEPFVPTSAEYRVAMQDQAVKAETAAVRLDLPAAPPSVDATTGEILEQDGADVVEGEIVDEEPLPDDRTELAARLRTATLALDPDADWSGDFYGAHGVSVEDAPVDVMQRALRDVLARAKGAGA